MTTRWFFALPKACTRLPRFALSLWIYSATGVEPTEDNATTSGCSISASTATLSPCTTLKTPLGTPASRNSSAYRMDADGVRSEGLSTNVLPHAAAIANIQHGTTIEIERRDARDYAEWLT